MSETISRSTPVTLYSEPWPTNFVRALAVLLALGILAFLVGIAGTSSARAWQIYLVNYLFWSGLAAAGVMLAAIWLLSDSVWGQAIRGVAIATSSFLPAMLLLYLPLIVGRRELFPWVLRPKPHHAVWYEPTFVFARDLVSLLLFCGLCFVFLYYSLRPTLGAAIEKGARPASPVERFFTSNWQGLEAEKARAEHVLRRLAPPLLILYSLVFSLISFDLVMSLDAHWYSTLFGAYYFIGQIYTCLAAVAMLLVFLPGRGESGKVAGSDERHQLAKLTFGFCMFMMMLFWSQYLVIWYGNLPEEIAFVIRRGQGQWGVLSVVMLLAALLVPFSVMLSRRVKQQPRSLFAICTVILVGMWLERYVLVVPSLWSGPDIPFAWLELFITGGFFAAATLCYWIFTRHFPIILLPNVELPAPQHIVVTTESAHS